ncbi:CHAT domain-containing protein [Flavihumibacter sp. CACIAM 22H1]|uniref:CHAT domain-containing tetratricopeptide repeat protein n=1 Tax=Flavihumibacter sp. CACIAM 22H1 TaxID=1812911 RepID=UPI0007A87679|nr:CHAT domain-containing protein [Flavihumibacter sp. CACIAM 22H1]KYP13199.1 MAG: hypothetical protein A1D16_01640 [Flavihumibacter sp. CACIAM 22H1]
MRKSALLYGLLAALFLVWKGFSQALPVVEQARSLFQQAETLYNSETPSALSDSLALARYQSVIELLEKQAPATGLHGEALVKRGNILQGQRQLDKAALEYRRALAWFDAFGKDSVLYFQACLHLGSNFYNGFKIDSARYYLEKAAAIAIHQPAYPDLDVLYNSLGALYFQSSNYLQAGNYFEKARMLLSTTADDYTETYNGFSNNIAICLAAREQYEEALQIYQPLLKDPYLKNRVRQNIGHLYFAKGKPDSALTWFGKVEPAPGIATVRMYHEMARIYLDKKEYSKAGHYLDEARRINQLGGESPKERAADFLLRSRMAFAIADPKTALGFIEAGEKGINENNAPLVLFELQELKSDIRYAMYEKTSLPAYLEAAVSAVLEAIETAAFIRSTYDNDEAKLFFTNNRHRVYQKAAERIYNWYLTGNKNAALEAFFQVEEQVKGSVLNDQLRTLQQRAGIDNNKSPLLQEEYELKQSMAYYSTLLNTLSNAEEIERVEKEMISTRVALSRLQNRIVALSGNKDSTAALGTLQHFQWSLPKDLGIISFLQSDAALFRLVITGKAAKLDKILLDTLLKEQLQNYVQALHTQQEGTRFKGARAGAAIYQALVAPVAGLLQSVSKCTILADGYLHLLPFEALPVDGTAGRYFLQEKSISYQTSFRQVEQQRAPEAELVAEADWLSFAPFQEGDAQVTQTGLAVLPFSAEEAGSGKPAAALVGTLATKEKFLQLAGTEKVLHLATHAAANKEENGYSWIKFYPLRPDSMLGYTLFLPEIYPLNLTQNELVIISACESANGTLASGEGLLSLSRAFLYAGSKGVIASLWKSEDQVTAYIIQDFRKQLKAGKSVEAALQAAKLKLLKDAAIPVQFKQPNYWAHLVYIGNCSQESSGFNWKVAGALVLGFLLVMSLVYFRKSSSSRLN